MNPETMLNQFVQALYDQGGAMIYSSPTRVSRDDTALLLIDVQKSVTKEYLAHECAQFGIDVQSVAPLLELAGKNVEGTLANIESILAVCRDKGVRPIHVKIEAYLPDAKDTGPLHARSGMMYPPGAPAAEFVPQAAPIAGEIVLSKTCSGVHVGTRIDQILRNLCIRTVIVVGLYTDQCISTSVRDLADLGYDVILVQDATNALSPERHDNAVQSLNRIYANPETTESLISRLSAL